MAKEKAMRLALETLDNMAKFDWHEWDEFASVEDFVRWSKSRASFIAEELRTALAQPKKEWVGLTDENIFSLLVNLQEMYVRPPATDSRFIFARVIEAKLKEKK